MKNEGDKYSLEADGGADSIILPRAEDGSVQVKAHYSRGAPLS